MTALSPDAFLPVVALVIFAIIVFWRVAIPLILAIVLAKVVVALATMVPPGPPAASALALGAALLT